jgi:hypothetical protein
MTKREFAQQALLKVIELSTCPMEKTKEALKFYTEMFPEDTKPVESPKTERRNVSRDDAICAMVRDPEQHCWGEMKNMMDTIEYKWDYSKARVVMKTSQGWEECHMTIGYKFYLDPPEAK